MSETVMLSFEQLRRDGGTQTRSWIDPTVVAEYEEAMLRGEEFPPGLAFYDGTDYWLVDGFHRAKAREQAGLAGFECVIQPGTQEEAQWASYGVNANHGVRRNAADTRRAIEAALRHPKSQGLSDRAIAEHVGCDHKTVGAVRNRLAGSGEIPQSDTRVGRDGRAINVSGINAGRGESSQGTDGDGEDDGPQAPEGGWPKAGEDGVYDDDQAEVLPEVVGKRWCDIKVMQVEPPSLLWKQQAWISAWSIGCQPCVESQQLSTNQRVFATRDEALSDAALRLAIYCGTNEASENVPKTVKDVLARFRQWAMVTGSLEEARVQSAIKREAELGIYRLDSDVEDYNWAIKSLLRDRTEFTLNRMAARFVELASDPESEEVNQYQNLDTAINRLTEFVAAVRVAERAQEAAGVSE